MAIWANFNEETLSLKCSDPLDVLQNDFTQNKVAFFKARQLGLGCIPVPLYIVEQMLQENSLVGFCRCAKRDWNANGI